MMQLLAMYINVRAYETCLGAQRFVDKLTYATRRWKLPAGLKHQLRCMIGQDAATPDMLACDTGLRVASQSAMVQTLLEYWPSLIDRARSLFFITFADDCGITSDRTPVLRYELLQQKVFDALQGLGLSAVVQTEVQGLSNYPQKGLGRLLLTNSHAIAWADVSPRTISRKVGDLNRSGEWSNQFEIQPVHQRHMRNGLADLVMTGHYIDKIPDDTKNLFKGKLYETMVGYRDEFALRTFEALSHLRLPDLVMGVGEGKVIRDAWEGRVMAWHQTRPELDLKTRFLPADEFWRQAREGNGSLLFEPFEMA